MGKKDPRVDAYIAKSADFAKPILTHLREMIHKTCPTVEETMKWSFPHFLYKGPVDRSPRNLCSMAGFKQHCAFGFWYAAMSDSASREAETGTAMGQYGRIGALTDLPKDKVLAQQIRDVVKIHDSGVKPRGTPRSTEKKELEIPDYLTAALKKNKKAMSTFTGFNYSHKKDYVEWLSEAKTDDTRNKRLLTAIEWMSEGKPRNWKYMKK